MPPPLNTVKYMDTDKEISNIKELILFLSIKWALFFTINFLTNERNGEKVNVKKGINPNNPKSIAIDRKPLCGLSILTRP